MSNANFYSNINHLKILREAHVGAFLGASTVGGSNIFFAGLQNKLPHKYSRFHNLSEHPNGNNMLFNSALGPIPDNRANEVGFDAPRHNHFLP
jgi:hypothetical protein